MLDSLDVLIGPHPAAVEHALRIRPDQLCHVQRRVYARELPPRQVGHRPGIRLGQAGIVTARSHLSAASFEILVPFVTASERGEAVGPLVLPSLSRG